jgi:hypothetical protein
VILTNLNARLRYGRAGSLTSIAVSLKDGTIFDEYVVNDGSL